MSCENTQEGTHRCLPPDDQVNVYKQLQQSCAISPNALRQKRQQTVNVVFQSSAPNQ